MSPPQDQVAIKEFATMVSQANSIFLLRALFFIASIIAVALVASSHFQISGVHFDFEDIATFRYVMAVAAMSLVYSGVQLPFTAYYALKHKRLIPHRFEFYADKVIGALLATGSGAGIAVARELKKAYSDGGDSDDYWERGLEQSEMKPVFRFTDKLLAGSVFLLLAWLCLALVSIIYYYNHNHNHNHNNTNPIISAQPNTTLEPSPPKESPQPVPPSSSDGLSV